MAFKKVCVLLIALIMTVSFIPGSVLAFNDANRVYLYVALDGNDAAEGTIDAPFATITAARNKIRALKAQGVDPQKGFVVYVRGGDYDLKEGLHFEKQDSGKEGAPIVYRAYPGEKVSLLGGAKFLPDDFEKVTDATILNRVVDETARENIYSVNLKKLGFTTVGEPYFEGAYSYTNADIISNKPLRSPEVFADGELLSVSRYPNQGFMTVKEVFEMGYQKLGIPGAMGEGDPKKGFTITANDERVKKWASAPSGTILLQGYWYYDWADGTVPIKSIDASSGKITSTIPHTYGVKNNQRFFAYNLLEEIDIPGEYFIDRTSGVLYIYPPKDMAQIGDISISILDDDIITVDGAEYIDFKDFEVSISRKRAVHIVSGKNIRIMNFDISYTADKAVQIEQPARNCGVMHSYIHDVNGGIVLYGGEYDNLEPGENYAENNHIERFSRLTRAYNGGITLEMVGNIARYNEINDGPHLGVFFGGQNQVLEYNEIYNVLNEADDMGAIYGGQTWRGRGLQMRYNYVHDLKSDSGQSVGKAGIYLDGGQCSVTMIGNVMENIEGSAFWINGGQNNYVYNNIAVDCSECVYLTDIMATGIIPIENMYDGVYNFSGWTDPASEPWKNAAWTTAYPEMMPQLESKDPLLPYNNLMRNNLIVRSKATKFLGSAGSYLNMENNYITNADPGFVDMQGRNYLLKEDAKLPEELGDFKKLPFTRMGRYDSRSRQRVKGAVVLTINSPVALKDGKECMIDAQNLNVVPKIINDSTFVPLRFLAEGFGAEVTYDDATRGIKIVSDGNTLELTVDSTAAKKNGEAVTLDMAPVIEGGRTIIPLRNIVELLGKKVYWNDIGLIVVSDNDEILSDTSDTEMINYLYELTSIY